MSEIIVKSKTEIAKASKTKDILASYGVPEALDSIVKKEKSNILNMLDCGAVVADSINKISNSEEYFVEIPKRLREALKNGTAEFDKSGKNISSFTPNIRTSHNFQRSRFAGYYTKLGKSCNDGYGTIGFGEVGCHRRQAWRNRPGTEK